MSYLQALHLVLIDLYEHSVSGATNKRVPDATSGTLGLRVPSPQPVEADVVHTLTTTVGVGRDEKASSVQFSEPGTSNEAYVSVVGACLYLRPVIAFDECQVVLPYATALTIRRHEGRFSQVRQNSEAAPTGWILKDELTTSVTDIFPVCTPEVTYDAYHKTTIAIRRLLNDEFRAGELFLPLQAVEYVTYQLLRHKRTINWPNGRPREAGMWHTLLRGVSGVHSGLAPHTGALMEWYDEAGEGCLAYTEVVRPDGTVVVSRIAAAPEGQLVRLELSPRAYREIRAIFILVT